MTLPVLGLRPMRAARLRASKFPKPVICTLAPLFSSPAMIPLSSNRASIVRVASALDILVRIASAAVSSALFTVSPCECPGPEKTLESRPFSAGASENPHKTATILGAPRKSARWLGFPDLRLGVWRLPCPLNSFHWRLLVSWNPPRLDRSDRRGHVLRQERGADPAGAAGGDRPRASAGLQVSP